MGRKETFFASPVSFLSQNFLKMQEQIHGFSTLFHIKRFKKDRELKRYMKKIIQVKIYRGEKYYVAECIDLPVVTQGKTLDEVVKNIKEAIELHLEGENLKEWDIMPDYSILVNFELSSYAKA